MVVVALKPNNEAVYKRIIVKSEIAFSFQNKLAIQVLIVNLPLYGNE